MNRDIHQFGLSRPNITMFEQCPRQLWLSVHRPELASVDHGVAKRFATEHEVCTIARSLLPDSVTVEAEPELPAALARTRALIDGGHGRPIVQATLQHDGVLVRIDVLEPDGEGGWKIVGVRSSTKAKPHHLGDLATELWVARHSGVSITRVVLRHINSSFTLGHEGALDGLLSDTDVTAEAESLSSRRNEVVTMAREVLAGPEPDIAPGAQCDSPFSCRFAARCDAGRPPPPEWPVIVLPNGGGKRWLEQNIHDLLAVDPARLTNPTHKRVHEATVTGRHYHDVDGARAAMAGWAFPRTWLDFETIAFAIPRWVGTRPYQQVPFQFSAHVEDADGLVEHHEFLSLDGADPRRSCAEALLAMVPATGAVIGYNATFEKMRILELAADFADLAGSLRDIADRIVDLLPVTRANWYHRDQRGSWSIKAVLPTMAPELDYAGLQVKDGGDAQQAYLEAATPGTSDARRTMLDAALRAYCGRDTEAMIVLARRLGNGGRIDVPGLVDLGQH